MNRTFILLAVMICLPCGSRLVAQTQVHEDKESCLRFTQNFYSWYVAKVFKSFDDKNAEPLLEALNYEGHPFSSELVKGIREVKTEEEKSHEALLDFDPILNSQDPAEHYLVRKVAGNNRQCHAEIYGVWDTPPSDLGKGPQVIADMVHRQGRWIFVNFHYPGSPYPKSENLLSILRTALR